MSVFIEFEGRRYTATNAASEDTLNQIAGLIGNLVPRQRRIENDTANANRQQSRAASQAATSMQDLAQDTKQSTFSMKSLFSQLTSSFQEADYGVRELWQDTKSFGKELTATAINVSGAWLRLSASIQDDPLRTGTMQMNTAIDIASQATSGFGKALMAAARDLLPGGSATKNFISSIARGLGMSVQGLSTLSADILKMTNNILSAELDRTVKAMASFNKMGGSFSGGMLEMRQNARMAGLTVDRFAKSVEMSRKDFIGLGVNVADGSELVGKQLYYLANTTGKSGQMLREELNALGYSYEEQGALAVNYMATIKAANGLEGLRNKTQRELAEGTRKYAEDLKVLADITGQDAKAAAERARVEVQRAGLLNKLGPEQRESFQEAFRVMGKLPANLQEAVMNRIMGLPITDPTIAIDPVMMDMAEKISQGVLTGQKNMQDATAGIIADTQKLLKEQGQAGQGFVALSDQLSQLKVGGLTADYAKTVNALILDPMEREQIERARKAAADMGTIPDDISKSVVAYNKSVTEFASQMSVLAGTALPKYSQMIEGSIQLSTETITAILKTFKGELDNTGLIKTLEKLSEAFAKMNPFLSREDFERSLRERVPGRARGGVDDGPDSGYLRMLHGAEAVVPLPDGRTIPVSLSGLETSFSEALTSVMSLNDKKNVSNSISGLENSFTAAMMAAQKQKDASRTDTINLDPIKDIPTVIGQTLEQAFNGPSGMVQVMNTVKNQLADDSKLQLTALQEQIENLRRIADAIQEGVLVGERIANELA